MRDGEQRARLGRVSDHSAGGLSAWVGKQERAAGRSEALVSDRREVARHMGVLQPKLLIGGLLGSPPPPETILPFCGSTEY